MLHARSFNKRSRILQKIAPPKGLMASRLSLLMILVAASAFVLSESFASQIRARHSARHFKRRTLSVSEINELWTRVQPSPSYFLKFTDIMSHKGVFKDKRWDWKDKDFPRVRALLDFDSWIDKHRTRSVNHVLAFSWDAELQFLRYKTLDMLEYSDGKNDLHLPLNVTRPADMVLLGQTLEHVYNPYACVKNIYDAMAPGGFFFTSVPYVNKPHMTPIHFFHYTPSGLAVMLHYVGFDVLELGQFGNTKYTDLVMRGTWPDYLQMMDEQGHIVNDPNVPAQVWALVRKPFS